MKHLTITIILFLFIGTTTNAQKHKLSINANSTTTFIPNFDYYVHIATEPIIYDFMDLSNYTHISSSYQEAKTKPKLGFSIDIEYSNRLNKRLSVLFAIGINQMRYEYDTEMNDNGAIYSLTDLDKDYGNTTLYYLNIRPFNYSVSFNENKTSIFGGPILSLLLKSKSCNAVGLYTIEENNGELKKWFHTGYFDSTDDLHSSDEFTPFTYGLNLGVKTRIYKNINFYFSGNYHFQSVYNQNIDFITSLKSCKPLQIKMGLSIDLL